MNCPNLETWTAFYGGETSEAETERLADHLQECPRCRKEFDQLCGLGAAMRGALASPRKAPSSRPRAISPRRTSGVPLAVAAAFALAAVGLVAFLKQPPERSPVFVARAPATIEERPASEVSPPPPPARDLRPTTLPVETPSKPAPPVPENPLPPPVAPASAPLPAAEPARVPDRSDPTETRPTEKPEIVAALERVEGEVLVTTSAGRIPARSNQALAAGQGLATKGTKSRAVVRFPDGTRIDLGEKTVVAQIADRAGAKGIGKWVDVVEGTVTIDAAHQPADRAMVISSPQGDARVVGTVFRLIVEPASTRLEVLEGKVRLSRQNAAVDVYGGFTATTAPGVELAARPQPRIGAESVCRFSFEDGRLPKVFSSGSLEKGPDRSGSRFCVAGAIVAGSTAGGHVKLNDDGKGLFVYSDDLFLAFDYWADDSVRTLDLHMWSSVQQVTFGTTVWNTPREQWTHLVLPLSEFVRTDPDRLRRLKAGERVPNLWIQAGQPGGRLYLDNIEILRLRKKEGGR